MQLDGLLHVWPPFHLARGGVRKETSQPGRAAGRGPPSEPQLDGDDSDSDDSDDLFTSRPLEEMRTGGLLGSESVGGQSEGHSERVLPAETTDESSWWVVCG